jgi:hypothetical protein
VIRKAGWGLLALALICTPAWGGATADEKAVRAAILDYVEGVYEVAPERVKRSVHPQLAKRGYYKDDGAWVEVPMTFAQLVELAATYNKDGHIPADAPKEIEIFEVMNKTASAKLIASWGMDYFHLAKVDGKWQIMNVIWQSLPEE